MMDWLHHGLGLPDVYQGVIQDSTSSATLAAVLTKDTKIWWTPSTMTGEFI